MTKSKVWTSLAAGGALAIALTSAAFAADLSDTSFDGTSPAAVGAANAANASLPDRASSVASAVLAAVTGGSNPSAVASSGKSHQGASEQASNENATTENQAAENEVADNDNEAGHEASPAGTTSTKPGWGCGDTNHTHSGPPGNTGATSPCNKH